MGSVVVAGQGWMKMLSGEWLGPCQASMARSPPTSEQNSRDASSLSRISSKTVLAESIPDLLRPAVASGPEAIERRRVPRPPGAVYAAVSSGPPRRPEHEGRHDVNLHTRPRAGPAVGLRRDATRRPIRLWAAT